VQYQTRYLGTNEPLPFGSGVAVLSLNGC